jgi:AraC-like DNA-binding protein
MDLVSSSTLCYQCTEMAGTKMSKIIATGICSLSLLLASSTWASDAPCTPTGATAEIASICIYNVGKKPAFASLKAVVNGTVHGKLVNKRPWVLVNVRPGITVVGIDMGNTPHARRRVETVAGHVTYVRYVSTISTKVGFFDTSSETQALLQEVTASDALGDFDRLLNKRSAKRSRT